MYHVDLGTKNMSSIQGTRLVLSCSLPADGESTLLSFYWVKGSSIDTAIAITYWDITKTDPVNKPDFPMEDYEMTFNASMVKSDLIIRSVSVSDAGLYWCLTNYIPSLTGGNPKDMIYVTVAGKFESHF